MQGRLQAPSAATRATVVMALRFTFTEPAEEYDSLLRPIMAHLSVLIADTDLVRRLHASCWAGVHASGPLTLLWVRASCGAVPGRQTVKRVSLQALNSLAHNKPSIVRGLLAGLFPVLYDATIIRVRATRESAQRVARGPRACSHPPAMCVGEHA